MSYKIVKSEIRTTKGSKEGEEKTMNENKTRITVRGWSYANGSQEIQSW
jgi:hypothetical protein